MKNWIKIGLASGFLVILANWLTGCGTDNVNTVLDTRVVEVPAAVQDKVSMIVADENAYRLSKGQLPLAPGLTCSLHNLSATTPSAIPTSPPAAVATFAYIGAFNQEDSSASDGLNVLPTSLRSLYTSWFLVKCSGYIVITDSGYHSFSVRSDDGSKLYIGGTSASNLVVNNDGNHPPTTVTGTIQLHSGVVSIQLQYLQGPGGMQALVLSDESGVVPGSLFYR